MFTVTLVWLAREIYCSLVEVSPYLFNCLVLDELSSVVPGHTLNEFSSQASLWFLALFHINLTTVLLEISISLMLIVANPFRQAAPFGCFDGILTWPCLEELRFRANS